MSEISIIIPVYNVEKYLRECLDSVSAQTFTDWEAICVNDGSTDGSLAILEEYAAEDPRFKIISQLNGGLSAARNTGISSATGKYIYFLDSDDWIEASALETCYKTAEQYNLEQVIFSFTTKCEPDIPENGWEQDLDKFITSVQAGTDFFINAVQTHCYAPSAWLRFIRLDFWKKNSFAYCEGIFYEDLHLHPRCDLVAKRVIHLPQRLYHYRLRSQSVMQSFHPYKSTISYFVAYQNFQELIKKYNADDKVKNALHYIAIQNMFFAIQYAVALSNEERQKMIADNLEIKNFLDLLFILQTTQQIFDQKVKLCGWDETERLREKLDFILHRSISYKIGKAIMWLPQKIFTLLKGRKNA